MTNEQIAAVFDEIADILEFQGADPFRVRAYRNAAQTLAALIEPAAVLAAAGRLTEIAGIGDDLAAKIAVLVADGRLPMLEELRAAVPASVLALMRVPGVGPKKAAALRRELHINSLDDLRAACTAGRVRTLPGFGEKTETALLAALDRPEVGSQRMLWAEADRCVRQVLEHMHGTPGVRRLEPAGSYRRGRDTVGDLDFLLASDDGRPAMDRLAALDGVERVLQRGETKMSLRLATGVQVDLRVVPEASFGAAWLYFTGSKNHNVVLRSRAKDRGLKVNEYGVFRGDRAIAGRTEEEVYRALDLPWIPPELREARREFDWADAGRLPRLSTLR